MNKRKCEETHPWITFSFNWGRVPYWLWSIFGEIQSKIEHIANTPLTPGVALNMNSVYMAKGVFATSAIEGNTLTEEQALEAVEGKLQVPASQEYDAKALNNVIEASNEIVKKLIDKNDIPITFEQICYFNKQVLQGLPLEEGVIPGEITHQVGVADYKGAPREDCQFLLEQLCKWLNGPRFEIEGVAPIITAVIKAIVAHVYVAWIHPFGDGNGRTARLLEMLILLKAGVPVPVGHLLSNHYNFTRNQYYAKLREISKKEDIYPFIEYAAMGLRDQLVKQIGWITHQLLDLLWNVLVDSIITGTTAHVRRHKLLLKSLGSLLVHVKDVRNISADVAREYAKVSDMTFRRDIIKLVELDLLKLDREKETVCCNYVLLHQFVPFSNLRV